MTAATIEPCAGTGEGSLAGGIGSVKPYRTLGDVICCVEYSTPSGLGSMEVTHDEFRNVRN
jgi:hypothetical protein